MRRDHVVSEVAIKSLYSYQRTTIASTIHYRIPTVQSVLTAGQKRKRPGVRCLLRIVGLHARVRPEWSGRIDRDGRTQPIDEAASGDLERAIDLRADRAGKPSRLSRRCLGEGGCPQRLSSRFSTPNAFRGESWLRETGRSACTLPPTHRGTVSPMLGMATDSFGSVLI